MRRAKKKEEETDVPTGIAVEGTGEETKENDRKEGRRRHLLHRTPIVAILPRLCRMNGKKQ
jgi:hypothetical protein